MKLYTLPEILADIEQLEGVDLSDSTIKETREVRFFCLYSQCNPEPVPEGTSTEALVLRINEFIQGPFSFINADMLPNPEMGDWIVYEVNFSKEEHYENVIEGMKYLGSCDSYDRLKAEYSTEWMKQMGINMFLVCCQSRSEALMLRIASAEEIEIQKKLDLMIGSGSSEVAH